METPKALLKFVAKAALNAVGGGILGDLAIEVLPDLAQDVWAWWAKNRNEAQRRAEVEALARAPAAAVREAVAEVVAEEAADRPPEVRRALATYLNQVPACIRQSLRRPADPGGLSLPIHLSLQKPQDLLPLLPVHLPKFQPGDRPLAGVDWELVELLGSGGFGEVWKARNPHFPNIPPVALKFCLDPAAKDRLLRHEASVLNQVMRQGKHPGIVPLQHTYLSADPPCLEYEYVEGGDLAGLIQEWHGTPAGPEIVDKAARLILDLARVVAFAHRLNPPIVHRDLKPANILVQRSADGTLTLRVADFGIGGVAAGRAIAQTRGASAGLFLVTSLRGAHTPLYAPPQQQRGDAPDPRDDVHALGVIWYQLLTGNLTAGRPGGARWMQRLTGLGMSAALVDLLAACVEEEAADRPADAGMLAEQLAALLAPAPAAVPAAPKAEATEKCPQCGGPMERRYGKYGAFLGCLGYPVCKGTRELSGEPGKKPRLIEPPPPVDLPRQLTNSVGMKLVLIPAGTFLMGSPEDEEDRGRDEGPQHRVTISRPFYLGVYLVTQREYEKVMGRNPAHFTKANGGGPDHPVENVSWEEAKAFCLKLSALAVEKSRGQVYRLPTEAEWEYACRAGTATPFAFGAALSAEQANFDGRYPYGRARAGAFLQKTTKVGQYLANPWGLFDMHGNVWEWCSDWYRENFYSQSPEHDPQGPASDKRVLRGGSWNNKGHLCRAAHRIKYSPNFRNDTIGFRVALMVT